ncbi:hypothetical protein NKH77_07720 [Streptomyces sp. M19]
MPAAAAKYELTVTAADTADGLELTFEADGGRCAEPELAAWCGQFRRRSPPRWPRRNGRCRGGRR